MQSLDDPEIKKFQPLSPFKEFLNPPAACTRPTNLHPPHKEGKTSGGRSPVSPWGQSAKGLKTRKPKRSDKLIRTRRKKRKR